jgi:hypothetical protein
MTKQVESHEAPSNINDKEIPTKKATIMVIEHK